MKHVGLNVDVVIASTVPQLPRPMVDIHSIDTSICFISGKQTQQPLEVIYYAPQSLVTSG